jgi:hypothetical protein
MFQIMKNYRLSGSHDSKEGKMHILCVTVEVDVSAPNKPSLYLSAALIPSRNLFGADNHSNLSFCIYDLDV